MKLCNVIYNIYNNKNTVQLKEVTMVSFPTFCTFISVHFLLSILRFTGNHRMPQTCFYKLAQLYFKKVNILFNRKLLNLTISRWKMCSVCDSSFPAY